MGTTVPHAAGSTGTQRQAEEHLRTKPVLLDVERLLWLRLCRCAGLARSANAQEARKATNRVAHAVNGLEWSHTMARG